MAEESGRSVDEIEENQVEQEGNYRSEEESISTEEVDPDNNNITKEKQERLNSFIQSFNDDCPIRSPILKAIASPDRPSALDILGTKYNNLMERYQLQTKKCSEECEPKYETLKKKYTEEFSERKRLYNELIELRGNIRVFCRCRPLNNEEISKGCSSVVEIDPSQDTELQIISSDSSKKQFKFDHVFGPADNQETVFAETQPVVISALDGYNMCIFAYGQTGTGKTFTMEGTPENRGVNYRALLELFKITQERSSFMKYEFSVSMLEVYNEKIRDLLMESSDLGAKKLEIKQSADGTQEVPGLVEAQVCTIDQVWEMLQTGARNRSVGSTAANELSSRSHCLVRVTIKSEDLVSGQRRKSNLWLVDLAGSERVSKIESEGERLKESQFINKSLSALGDVISALVSKNTHIPYRNSKLTHLLQSSLGGDCKTLMFVQISPSLADLGETTCSLNFATRVRGIEHGPARKQSDPAESFKLKQMMEKLRQEEKERARLNEQLQLVNLKYASREAVFKSLQEKIRDAEQACKNYQQRVRELESQLADEKRAARDIQTATKFKKPPLAPPKQRPPLVRITNRLSTSNPQKRASLIPTLFTQNKENIPTGIKRSFSLNLTNKMVGKARRVSIAPLTSSSSRLNSAVQQPKRRSSIAIAPSAMVREPQSVIAERKMAELERQLSQLPNPRRRSMAAVGSVPVPATPVGTVSSSKLRRIIESGNSKFASSPPPMIALWKSRIPTVSNYMSPRQRLRLVSSPVNRHAAQQGTASKLCFSVQKRVVIGSPAQPRASGVGSGTVLNGSGAFDPTLLRDVAMARRRVSVAKRVLCNNNNNNTKRRMSVI